MISAHPLIQPDYLVHPVSGKRMLFDMHGNAVCPDCGALWHRSGNRSELMREKPRQQATKRTTTR